MRRNFILGRKGVAAAVLAAALALLLLAGCKTEGDDQPPAAETCTVTFNANADGDTTVTGKMEAKTVEKGGKFTLPENAYTRGGV